MKYTEAQVVFEEVPDEITLAINISNCPVRCEGCHSPHLWQDVGTELTSVELLKLLKDNKGVTCVSIMGGDNSVEDVLQALKIIKNKELKTCWYSGKERINDVELMEKLLPYLDYLKTGPYIKELGGLDSFTTNQRFFIVKSGINHHFELEDITYKFKKLGI